MEAGRLSWGWWRGQESLGITGEVLAAVRGIEAFWEDDEGGASFGGFENFGAGTGEVDGLIGSWQLSAWEKWSSELG